MRHNKKFNHLSRTASHRAAMLSNMAVSLIMHKRITTTVAKAKALKKYVEPMITRSKEDTTNARRVVFSYLQDKQAITELFSTISAKVADRPGGYTVGLSLSSFAISPDLADDTVLDYGSIAIDNIECVKFGDGTGSYNGILMDYKTNTSLNISDLMEVN